MDSPFADNLTGFGRALRRAGVPLDAARIALAHQAVLLVGVASRSDFSAALEAVLINREQDRWVFRELFEAYFGPLAVIGAGTADPALKPAALAPPAGIPSVVPAYRPRVQDALVPQAVVQAAPHRADDAQPQTEAALSASDRQRLQHADFNALSGAEYTQVERLARSIPLPLPHIPTRRMRPGSRGHRMHWPGVMHEAAQTGGELLRLPRLQRREQALPLLVLLDVSGSMARYSRLLLAFLHAATHMGTRSSSRREVFAFGTELTDLSPAFGLQDTDAMLASASQLIADFAGGTRLGWSLATLRRAYPHRLLGSRTLVLLVTDGLDTGAPAALASELDWLRRHSRRLLWLNPLLRFEGYAPLAQGAAVLHAQVHGTLAVHNLAHLRELADGIARLLAQ